MKPPLPSIRIKPGSLFLLTTLLLTGTLNAATTQSDATSQRPNILLILVDDMGYGDPQCFNPKSRLKTPAIDRLASEGLMFRDAHAPHSTCIASRYGLLTGRYPMREHWRLISSEKLTLPKLLKRNGYSTGMVGKWHVGFDNFKGKDGTAKQTMTGGPVDRGFDEFFGLWGSLDQAPYFYMKNRSPVEMPTEDGAGKNYPDEEPDGQLYDLAVDPSEQNNLWDEKPEMVRKLTLMLEAEKANKKNLKN